MIPYFIGGVYNTSVTGYVSIGEMIDQIYASTPEWNQILAKVREASKNKNEKAKAYYKAKLPYYTPAVQLQRRRYEFIEGFTGLMPVDFDKLREGDAIELKKQLMTHDYVICAWLSASGKGVRAIVHVPHCYDVFEYKGRFKALAQELSIYNGFDYAPQCPILPLYYSHDSDILINDNFVTFKKIIHDPPVRYKSNFTQYVNENANRDVINIITNRIKQITTEGHYILRASSYALGGYVASNYITESDAVDLISKLISEHGYLSQKRNQYLKTAKEMIIKGQSQALTL